jgi:argininosuccinate synthase
VGIKSREIYEAPAAIALVEAHRALEDLVLTRDELRCKRVLETRWTELVYEGSWFSPLRAALDAFVDVTQERVTGDVRLALQPSAAVVVGRRSEHALYSEGLASYAEGETFPHDAAEGFIALQALETDLLAALETAKAGL